MPAEFDSNFCGEVAERKRRQFSAL